MEVFVHFGCFERFLIDEVKEMIGKYFFSEGGPYKLVV